MTSTNNSNDNKYLGDIISWIVGLQYFKEKVTKVQEFYIENPLLKRFDENAIEVITPTGKPFGILSMHEANYLKPLIETGKIFVKGHTLGPPKDNIIMADIRVNLAPNGKSLLRRKRGRNAETIIHNLILEMFLNKEKYSLKTITKLGDYYYKFINVPDIFPETKLLFHLTPFKSYFDKNIEPLISKIAEKNKKVKQN